ncbi:MAG: hypothetical protein LBC80_03315, partial [Treponema sp.]|nr:hypothetical protein [Treponema sp.]
LEKWRDYQFHKNLAKVDERMLKLQWKEDGLAEGRAEGRVQGHAQGHAEGRAEGHAQGRAEADAEWQTVLAAKDTELAADKAEIARLRKQLADNG